MVCAQMVKTILFLHKQVSCSWSDIYWYSKFTQVRCAWAIETWFL